MYDDPNLFNNVTHQMQLYDVGMTSLFIAAGQSILSICQLLPSISTSCVSARSSLQSKVDTMSTLAERLWDDKHGVYANMQSIDEIHSRRLSPTSFFPLIAALPSVSQAETLLIQHLQNEDEFCVLEGCPGQPLPSIARNDANYTDQSYWRGRQWGPHTMLTWWGLTHSRYGGSRIVDGARHQLAKQVDGVWKDEWRKYRHVHENYDGDSAEGCNTGNSDPLYSWGALNPYVVVQEWSIQAERRWKEAQQSQQRARDVVAEEGVQQSTHPLTRRLSLPTTPPSPDDSELKSAGEMLTDDAQLGYALSRTLSVQVPLVGSLGSDHASRYFYIPSSADRPPPPSLGWIGVVNASTGAGLPPVYYVNGSFGFGQPPFSPSDPPRADLLRVDAAGLLYVYDDKRLGMATITSNGTWLAWWQAPFHVAVFDVTPPGHRMFLRTDSSVGYSLISVHSLADGLINPTPLYSVRYDRLVDGMSARGVAFDSRGDLYVLVTRWNTDRSLFTDSIEHFEADGGQLLDRWAVGNTGDRYNAYYWLLIGGDDDMAVTLTGALKDRQSLCWMRLQNTSLTCVPLDNDSAQGEARVSRGVKGQGGWALIMANKATLMEWTPSDSFGITDRAWSVIGVIVLLMLIVGPLVCCGCCVYCVWSRWVKPQMDGRDRTPINFTPAAYQLMVPGGAAQPPPVLYAHYPSMQAPLLQS